jgi:NAD(P)-dependent dehydrogenase (short-subunit alcohol dehydrogenase family)
MRCRGNEAATSTLEFSLGKPDEIACAVAFFLPDEAVWIAGAHLSANGGHYMGW